VVSDGSTDQTVRIAAGFTDRGVRVIEYPDNGGKGHALRVGLAERRGEYVAFMDADGDIGAEALRPFLTLMDTYHPDVILGSKRHPLSEVDYPPARRLMSWVYHKLTRVLFRVNVRDTQTGIKLVRREVLAACFPAWSRRATSSTSRCSSSPSSSASIGLRSSGEHRLPVRQSDEPAHTDPDADADDADLLSHAVLNAYGLAPSERQPIRRRPVARGAVAPRRRSSDRGTPADPDLELARHREPRCRRRGGVHARGREAVGRAGPRCVAAHLPIPGARGTERIDGVRVLRVGRLRRGTYHLLVQRRLARLSGYDVILDEINTLPFLTPLWQDHLPPTLALIHQLADDIWELEVPRPLAMVGRRVEPHLLRMYRDVPVATVSGSTMADLNRLGLRDVRVVLEGRDEAPPVGHLSKEAVPTFVFIGRLAANKRPDHAIAAFRRIRESLPDARLWVIGVGALEAQLRVGTPDGVEFLGRVSRQEMYERMARAHCLLVPSLREGWGLVITEANSVGTPAAGYDAPGSATRSVPVAPGCSPHRAIRERSRTRALPDRGPGGVRLHVPRGSTMGGMLQLGRNGRDAASDAPGMLRDRPRCHRIGGEVRCRCRCRGMTPHGRGPSRSPRPGAAGSRTRLPRLAAALATQTWFRPGRSSRPATSDRSSERTCRPS
jgi:hypothetical protein